MSGYKYIETMIARYIAGKYRSVIEVGTGSNTTAAELLSRAGIAVLCTDLSVPDGLLLVRYQADDICNPNESLYLGAECIYAIRPIEEMMGSLIRVAKKTRSDLIIYHLGFEGYSHPHRIIECGITLFHYVTHQN
ncbi:MAG TPA: UPF0146 family protein [Methanospirillum sp.]|nr:UPF0146 family protein [Methanospirillum sp.]